MTNRPVLALAGACLAAIFGCQSPLASRPTAPGLDSHPPPAESSFDPLGNFEKSLVFAPSRYPAGDWQPARLAFEDAWFAAKDGTRLHGWYAPSAQPRAVVLYCHGNGGNVALWAGVLRMLHDRMGVTAMLFDYRGYGRSEGTPSEAGVLADARAARTWLAQRAGVAENQIVLMGRSLGGAVAVDLAADGARGLILESTFTSMPEVAHTMLPYLPVRLVMRTQFNSLAKIAKYHGPLLQSHGTADRLIPYAMGQQLFAAANEPKQFIAIPGGDHNDPPSDVYYAALFNSSDRCKTPAPGRYFYDLASCPFGRENRRDHAGHRVLVRLGRRGVAQFAKHPEVIGLMLAKRT